MFVSWENGKRYCKRCGEKMEKEHILSKIKSGLFLLDGGMGTMLQSRGLPAGEQPERWNLSHAETVTEIHRAYLNAGAQAVTTNTFGANALKFDRAELEHVIDGALNCARRAVNEAGKGYILFDIGPSGKLLKPYGDLDFEDAVKLFAQTVRLVGNRADAILIETMSDGYETKAAVLAAKENSDLPVFVTNVYGKDGKLTTGADIPAMVALLEGLRVDALGMNCSLGSEQMLSLLPKLYEYTSLPVIVRPNAGLPREEDGKTVYGEDEQTFSDHLVACALKGARILGGCCGTTPAYLRTAAEKLKSARPLPVCERNRSLVSSYTHAAEFGGNVLLIGERINPTGKKRLKQALAERDFDYLAGEAVAQEEQGAHLLDVNVGVPGLDEPILLAQAVSAVQTATDLPLQLDSASSAALEKAMRIYNGKPMVNSVNGKQAVMDAVFPLVKKYGGLLVALTLDEGGIPATAEGRLQIARRILREGKKYGIEKKDMIFDPLAMAVSAEIGAPRVTLNALNLLRDELGVNTVLGVSNVSFGLPARETVTAAFLQLALENGLKGAIVNPLSMEIQKTYRAFLLLNGKDENCSRYVAFACAQEQIAPPRSEEDSLKSAILRGRKERAGALAKELLKTLSPLEIIDQEIVPALDEAGAGFEEKRIYLPQLLMCAEAAKGAFSQIKEYLARTGGKEEKKCAIVLATVKGDVHDIGKNIVKALLENYSFAVSDLGKDVLPETVAEEVVRLHAPVAGLSALMTTTVPAMEQTIALLRQRAPWCKVIVGGAVLTEEYVKKIGADCYGKDAMATVRFCESVYRNGR